MVIPLNELIDNAMHPIIINYAFDDVFRNLKSISRVVYKTKIDELRLIRNK